MQLAISRCSHLNLWGSKKYSVVTTIKNTINSIELNSIFTPVAAATAAFLSVAKVTINPR